MAEITAKQAEAFLLERYGDYRFKPTKYVASFLAARGAPLALMHSRKSVRLFVGTFPETGEMEGVSYLRFYPQEKSRSSNLTHQAPELAAGSEAHYVRVLSLEGLRKLADYSDTVDGDAQPKNARTERRDWSNSELKAAVSLYLQLVHLERRNQPLNKLRRYRELAKLIGRSEKSIEYRMQNISYVLAIQGRHWLKGLPPARNVGRRVATKIAKLISEGESRPIVSDVEFETQVRQLRAKFSCSEPPNGQRSPKAREATAVQYVRDPAVKAWVLENSQGICESCGSKAPFTSIGGSFFLEVHHVRRLTDGGSDRIENAVALCPNCHRAFHYSIDRNELLEAIYVRVERLERD